jgi:hypothetical protein
VGVGIEEWKTGSLLCRSLDHQILSERVTSIHQHKTTIFVTTAILTSCRVYYLRDTVDTCLPQTGQFFF